jgi:PAS domain S-box-containing protein
MGSVGPSDLAQENSLLQIVLQTVLDGMIVIDSQGQVQSFNRAAEKIFGYVPEEVIGQNVKMLMPAPYQTGHDGYLHNFLATGEKKVIGIGREVSARRKDGSVFPMELGVNELRIGETRLFVGTIRDISERKAAERQILDKTKALVEVESLHRMLMEGVADYAIIVLDLDGNVTTWNTGAQNIKGYKAEEIIGRHFSVFYTKEDIDQGVPQEALKKAASEGKFEEESLRVRKDGSVFWASVVIDPVGDDRGNLAGFVKVTRDITERKDAERQSKEEAARLQAVMDTVLDGLVTIDDRGTIQTFNPAAVRIFGYIPDEVIGRNVKMLMPEPYHGEHDGYLKNYLTSGEAKVIGSGREVSGRRKDGSVFPMELGVNKMEIDGARAFVGTVRDITERKRAEDNMRAEASRLQAVMNTVLDGLVTIDSHGVIRSFNPSSVRIFGYQPEEVIGKNVKMLMPDPYHSEHDGYLGHYLTTGEKKVIGIGREVSARRKDGSVFPMELGVNEMQVDDERMFVGTIRDISERKNAEASIHDYVEKLKRSNQELDDFAYIASHDLKEPIRGLSNNAVFLQEDYVDAVDDDGRRRLNRMVYLCRRMETLVDDLLYFSRLGRQELAVQKADLNAIVRDIELMMEITLQEQNAEIILPKPLPVIVCDVPRVTEVFRNLITNAVKYNDKSQKCIEIGAVAGRGETAELIFYVKDNGIGIEPRFYNDIFRIFKRLNEEDDAVKGTGVGLTFVKKIIERHSGRIWLESEPGEGTVFYFTLQASEG